MSSNLPPAPDLDLLASEVEDDLRATVQALLERRCSVAAVAAIYDGDRTVVEPLWKSLSVGLGLAGLLVPEHLGGAGASAVEAAAVLEELGRACAPVPFLTSSVLATTLLLQCDHEAARAAVAKLASGGRTAAVVVSSATDPDGSLPDIASTGSRVTGSARSVAGVIEADVLVVPARTPDGVGIHLVERSAATVTPVSSFDMARQIADVSFEDAAGVLIHPDGEDVLRSALLTCAGLLASEQVGVARWCLEETVAYLRVRKQFDRVVGGFQALKHRLADVYADVECAAAAARYAAAAISAGDDVAIAARVAAAHCGDVAVHAAEEAVQLHGGIGMTWEHPTHLYLKKAKADQIAFGAPGAHRAGLARLVDLDLGVPR